MTSPEPDPTLPPDVGEVDSPDPAPDPAPTLAPYPDPPWPQDGPYRALDEPGLAGPPAAGP